jgi:hypothetical protein
MEAGQGPNWGCSAKGEKKLYWNTPFHPDDLHMIMNHILEQL